jgi:hypothetical protein
MSYLLIIGAVLLGTVLGLLLGEVTLYLLNRLGVGQK